MKTGEITKKAMEMAFKMKAVSKEKSKQIIQRVGADTLANGTCSKQGTINAH